MSNVEFENSYIAGSEGSKEIIIWARWCKKNGFDLNQKFIRNTTAISTEDQLPAPG